MMISSRLAWRQILIYNIVHDELRGGARTRRSVPITSWRLTSSAETSLRSARAFCAPPRPPYFDSDNFGWVVVLSGSISGRVETN